MNQHRKNIWVCLVLFAVTLVYFSLVRQGSAKTTLGTSFNLASADLGFQINEKDEQNEDGGDPDGVGLD